MLTQMYSRLILDDDYNLWGMILRIVSSRIVG